MTTYDQLVLGVWLILLASALTGFGFGLWAGRRRNK